MSEGDIRHDTARVFVVRRGDCTFVTKVLVAQKKRANAVIIVDAEDSTYTAADIQNMIVADDGYGANVKIPSVLISNEEGSKLIEAAMRRTEPVIVELAWDIPTQHVVRVDLWLMPGGSEFLMDFKEKALALKWNLDFVPHWAVFDLPGGDFNQQCTDPTTAKYCCNDPDGSGPVTGKDVALEAQRLSCIRELTGKRDPKNSHNTAIFSEVWWKYVFELHKRCPLDGKTPATRFGPQCAKTAGKAAGVDEDAVDRCVMMQGSSILEKQKADRAWSPTALRINGWRFSGPHDSEIVSRAVCSAYVIEPPICKEISDPIPLQGVNVADNQYEGETGVLTILFVLAAAVGCLGFVLHLHRRYMIRDVRSMFQSDVHMEVKSHMAQYAQLRGQ